MKLKNRQVVELRNGSRYMVVGDVLMNKSGYLELKFYDDNFKYRTAETDFPQFDIVTIYSTICSFDEINTVGEYHIMRQL